MNASKAHQPKALPVLFLTEMWERFGFYVVQGLLILYMTSYFGFTDNEGYTILGVFSALVYISPFIGGFLADRILGFKVAIVWGGLFLVVGYAMLALPYTKLLFYPALATIIIGNGLFKPNISSLLGVQYTADDPRRDSGFTIFYIGINIGALLAGLSSGYIKALFGWHMSFALASIGLIIGLITFAFGLKQIKSVRNAPKPHRHFYWQLFFYCVLAVIGVNFLLRIQTLANWLLPAAGILLIVFLIVLTLQQKAEYRQRLFILNFLIVSSIVFWMLFLQMFFSANLFIDRLVEKTLWGIPLTTTVFYAIESMLIVLLGPLFAWLWEVLAERDKNPSPVIKFALGILFAGLGFMVLSTSTLFPTAEGLISPHWVFFAYLLITIGELLLSPIGLSAVTMLAPPHLIGMMMGVWFVATGFGGIFAGLIAKLASVPATAVTVTEKLTIYQNAFLDYAYFAFIVAIILFFMRLGLRKINIH
ncbi:MAG TPA: peptide MFS transporter [Gammaproteobacteria bacterium]|jgi:POT family proton-dependent oligopeptide transporter|nr:peptide MFS transporter [Gammaproteobacteria bacterium]